MYQQSFITGRAPVAADVFAAGHLGELTQVLDCALVDAVAEETGTVQKRVRILPTRVVIFFVLALALFEKSAYRQVWDKLVAGFEDGSAARPSASALSRARRRVGSRPLRALFEAVAGPVAWPGSAESFWRGLRTVAIDGASLHVRDSPRARARYRKRVNDTLEWGYPLLRLTALVECGTRAVIAAVFGPEADGGEVAYACRLAPSLRAGMLLLADAGYDSWTFLAEVARSGASFLCRSGAYRTPLILTSLPDGSYLSTLGYGRLRVRVIEALITVTYADGVVHTEQWRLLTDLLDHTSHPADELVEIYHRRWQIETAYFSIKCTILDGRILRSEHPDDIDQEVYAVLAVYQAIVRISADAIGARPARPSFTVAIETARNQVITARAIQPDASRPLLGPIGRAVLNSLLPPPRPRAKARSRKLATSKYHKNTGQHPQATTRYTHHAQVMIMEKGLTPRRRT